MHSIKYLYGFIVALVMAGFVAALVYGNTYIEATVIRGIAESYNKSVSYSLIKNILKKHQKAIFTECPPESCPEMAAYQKDLSEFKKTYPLLEMEAYSGGDKAIFSNGKFTTNKDKGPERRIGYEAAWKNETSSFRIKDYEINGEKHNVVITFFPVVSEVSAEGRPKIVAVIESVYDYTPIWAYTSYIIIGITVVIGAVLLIVIMVSYYTTQKTEQLLTNQYETNLDLVSAKAIAEEQSRQKSQFLANVSHELRTPLNAIIGFSEIIKNEVMGPLDNQNYKEYVNDIHNSGVHLLALINDILDYSKAEAGKLSVELAAADVNKVMKNCMRLVTPRAQQANVTLIERIPEKHYILNTDSKRLKQAILNLLSNAVKFTPANGKVTLYGWHDITADKFVIEVQDTGVGIAPKDISKVMQVFGQVESKLNRKHEGTGLGLPLCKKLVELMGGQLDIESEVGKGTTVKISLPYHGNEKVEQFVDKGF